MEVKIFDILDTLTKSLFSCLLPRYFLGILTNDIQNMTVKRVEVVVRSQWNALPLRLQSCDS